MFLQLLQDTIILFSVGVCGWFVFRLLRLPIASFLGPIFFIGAFKIAQLSIPPVPGYLSPLVQVFLGVFVGSKITRDTVGQLKKMIIPTLTIIIWAVSVVFLLGRLLASVTDLDLYTAMLSSSMGGLPEMTIIAMATNARVEVIVIVQLFRVVLTVTAFPLLLRFLVPESAAAARGEDKTGGGNKPGLSMLAFGAAVSKYKQKNSEFFLRLRQINKKEAALNLWRGMFTLIIGACGGMFFNYIGVPAGVMIGSMFFIAIASLTGIRLKAPSTNIFGLLMVGAGIMISDNITADTLDTLLSANLLFVVMISTVLIFLSSLVVAYFISKVSGWDYATSFLAAAPAGFTVMTLLAVKYDRDPFRVSILHLCRLVALKSVIPLYFMIISRL
ncbi:MAG: AbrB family transcriptional regulator [Dethiobacter sp.]|jgi:membrane AbrB-like protein|nr:AbrB family transcriptional regulator [Dethiobacter sp.]